MKIKKRTNCSDAAVYLNQADNRLCAASMSEDGAIQVKHFPLRDTTFAELTNWRSSHGQKTDDNTVFRFVPNLFLEHTFEIPLEESVLALNDSELAEWLYQGALSGLSGMDGNPIFENGLTRSAYDFTRLPGGTVSLTEIPRETLEQTRRSLVPAITSVTSEDLAEAEHYQGKVVLPEFLHAVETRLRVIARAVCESGGEDFSSLGSDESVAFFAFTSEGVAFAVWSPARGFYIELGDVFHLDGTEIPDDIDKGQYLGQLYGESVFNFLNDQFYRRIVPDVEEGAPINLRRIFWTAPLDLVKPLDVLIRDFSAQTNFPFTHLSRAMEELIVEGLLLGCADETTEIIPAINLANDIALQYEAILDQKQSELNARNRVRQRRTIGMMLLPVACALGLIAGLTINNLLAGWSLESRESAATAEKTRLQSLINERQEHLKTLSWYEDVLRQIIGLRKKQTAALGFSAHLDPLFPRTSAFYVSDLKLMPGGSFELKGLARDEFAVSEFARQMEFAENLTGSRYFSNLTLEFKQGSKISDTSSAVAGGVAGNLAPGVSGFFIKGNYAPAAIIKAQESKPAAAAPAAAPPAQTAASGAANLAKGGAK